MGGGQPRSLEYDPVEQGPQDPVSDNVQVGDLVEGKVAYINIPEMLGEQTRSIDEQKIDAYLSHVKDYPALILDIRGNPGGFDEYWRDMLLPKIVPEMFSTTQYLLFRDGETSKTLRSEYETEPISELANEPMTFAHPEDWQNFESYVKEVVEIQPAKDSIKFKGKIFLFADEGTYSSAEAMASFAKTSGLATLIGKVTAGDGITPGVLYRVLPNSGLVYTYTNALGYAGDGTINEETRTVPHILSDNPETEVLNHLEEDLVETAA